METTATKKQRNSSVEILRILAIFLVVLSHASCHGGFNQQNIHNTLNRLYLQISTLGFLGVDIFMMISGYFISKKQVSILSYFRFLCEVWFYSIATFFIMQFVFGYHHTLDDVIVTFFPTVFGKYPFFSTYFVVLLLSPYINLFISAANRRQYLCALITMLILWSVIPTVFDVKMQSSDLAEHVMYYMIGGYIRKYPDNIFSRKKVQFGTLLFCGIFMIGSNLMFNWLDRFFPILSEYRLHFFSRHAFPVIGCAVSLLSIAVTVPSFSNSFINKIASCTLGVYLLHDNYTVRSFLWTVWLDNTPYVNSFFFPLRMISSALLVLAVCTAIDYLRQKYIETTFVKFIEVNFIRRLPIRK